MFPTANDGYQVLEKNLENIGVNPNFPNASNPHHKCVEYCLEKFLAKYHYAGKDQQDGDQERKNFEKISLNLNGPSALNPSHKCTEGCMENMPTKHQYVGKDQLGIWIPMASTKTSTILAMLSPYAMRAIDPQADDASDNEEFLKILEVGMKFNSIMDVLNYHKSTHTQS